MNELGDYDFKEEIKKMYAIRAVRFRCLFRFFMIH